jgi:hypothetical protein
MPATNPKQVFQKVIADGIHGSIIDCWRDFAHWEHARRFADDPSQPAKAAIEWVLAWEELQSSLGEFTGPADQECRAALDKACESFAELNHSDELISALNRWREERTAITAS